MAFFNMGSTSSTVGGTAAAEKDIEVTDPPSDSISSLAFSSQADYLAVGSWDNNVCALSLNDSDRNSSVSSRRFVFTKSGIMDRPRERHFLHIRVPY
jgi:WD40 repeat protein